MRRTAFALGCLLVAAATGLTGAAAYADTLPGDLAIAGWVQAGFAGSTAAIISGAVSWISEGVFIGIGMAAGLILVARRRLPEAIAIAATAATALSIPIGKAVIARPRPPPELVNVLPRDDTGSYPSGHVFLAVAILGALLIYAPSICGTRRWPVLLFRTILAFVIAAVGLSRIYRGAHWPSDVLGTYLVSAVLLLATIWLCKRFVSPLIRRNAGGFGFRRLRADVD